MKLISTFKISKASNSSYFNDYESSKPLHHSYNPFLHSANTEFKTASLIQEFKFSNISKLQKNSLFNAALKCDPHAIHGLTTQIRIA